MEEKKCVECGYPVRITTWYRLSEGGRRRRLHFCDENCKAQWFSKAENTCFEEASYQQGYDVFVPIWVRMQDEK